MFVTTERVSFTELADALKAEKPDVVLMDLHMPGEDQANKVKERTDGTGLITMSIYNDLESQTLAASLGAVRLLDKGTLATTLVDSIHECLLSLRKASA